MDEPQRERAHDDEDERRVDLVFAAHLEEREAGRDADLDELCARHPELEDELRQLAQAVERVERALSSSATLEDSSATPATLFDPGASIARALLGRLASQRPAGQRYRILGEVGRGGMGTVHGAWDRVLRRRLAIKVAHADERGRRSPSALAALARFLAEAQVTGQLEHPGVVPVHELGLDHEQRPFFTMKLVRGEDLRRIFARLRAGDDDWGRARVLRVVLAVCDAVAYAHSRGVIHRDLKPANVMVGRFGEVYVMDWGLARVRGCPEQRDLRVASALSGALGAVETERTASSDSPLVTMDGAVIGTPAYMSPEQAAGRTADVDSRADVYSLGAMLYELLSGAPPYAGRAAPRAAQALLAALIQGPPASLASVARDAPAELVAICEKAMARDPKRRYADTTELAADLRAWLEGRVVSAHATGALTQLWKFVVRNRAVAALSAAAVAALALGALASTLLLIDARASERAARGDEQAALASEQDARRSEALARAARDRANASAARAAEAARVRGEEAEASERTLDLLTDMFALQRPNRARGRAVILDEVLALETARLRADPPASAAVRARLLDALAGLYASIGREDAAEPLRAEARRVRADDGRQP